MEALLQEARAFVNELQDRQLPSTKLLNEKESLTAILDGYDTFCFDCDGVIWRGNELLPESDKTLALLREKNKRIFFVTNNSSKSRAQYLQKFQKLGISVSLDEIIPSSWAAAEYLSTSHPHVKKAFVIGSQGLVDELALVGIDSVCGADPAYASRIFNSEADFLTEQVDAEIDAVVCGWDLTFNYAKLSLASLHLQKNKHSIFVATNKDAFDRLHDRNVPGNGCAVVALEHSVGKEAIIVGKPSHWLITHILNKYQLDPRRTLVIGDRLDTDIKLGIHGGTDSMLVGTGCTSVNDIVEIIEADQIDSSQNVLPSYIISHIGAIHDAFV